MRRLSTVLVVVLSMSAHAFVPMSNYELDLSVAHSQCIEIGSLDILDKTNSQKLCEVVVNSSICDDVEAVDKRRCDPKLIVESNIAVDFISCLKGLWGSAVEFMKFIGSVVDYIIDDEYRGEKNEELLNTLQSAKHMLAMEWSRSLSETEGLGPMHYINAAKHFSSTMGTIIFNMLQDAYYSTQANYACLSPAARTKAICQFAGSYVIPPTIVIAKVAKFLLKSGKGVKRYTNEDFAKNELETNIHENKDIDEDIVATKGPYSAESSFLARLDLSLAKRAFESPEQVTEIANAQIDALLQVVNKVDLPHSVHMIDIDGKKSKRILLTESDLASSSSLAAKELLSYMKLSGRSQIVISPQEMYQRNKTLIASDNATFVSSTGFANLLRIDEKNKLSQNRASAAIEATMINSSDENVIKLAKELNNQGFSVRVIESQAIKKGTNEVIKKKALQFNRFAADQNNPAVLRLNRFRNDDFRQKIIFYPDDLKPAQGSSNRATRTVSFNFSNLRELVDGGYANTVPHEFRHAKFEYNRSKGKESPYDLRVQHIKPDGKLHDGRTYTNYFSMEEVYNHAQDIHSVTRKIQKDPQIGLTLAKVSAKADTIINISRGFKVQNDSLNLNLMSRILPSQISKPIIEQGTYRISIGNDSFVRIIRDNNNYYSIILRDGDIEYSVPMASERSKNVLSNFIANADRAAQTNDMNSIASELKIVMREVMAKNNERRSLIKSIEPKAKAIKEAIKNTDYSNQSLEEIRELSRQLSQASKGRSN
ncbi:hypothetical protein M902_2994 [Bacteriovorax sp. BAL6_X]|uniref:hypothetical protein n=1 Tax=Bacteriovorax sp. BAL6_X TaxID=1201290 RepID=UPI000386358D|nr:hypothetical protein [Bacteriovorax sp. BAL6_X]EPZ50976.1 hypothetical protein M902_2994 [Bacteriovorax sp. BAL6_X]